MSVHLMRYVEDDDENEYEHTIIKSWDAMPSDAVLQETLTTNGIHNDFESRSALLDPVTSSCLMQPDGTTCKFIFDVNSDPNP